MFILGSLFWSTTKGAAPPVQLVDTVIPSGGIPAAGYRDRIPNVPYRKKTKEQIREEREALGIIEKVAERQVEALVVDKQQIFEEIERELESAGIAWQSRYLELLQARREELITQEISQKFRQLQRDEDETIIALLLVTM